MALSREDIKHMIQQHNDAEEWREAHMVEGRRIIQYREGRRFSPDLLLDSVADRETFADYDLVPDHVIAGHYNSIMPSLGDVPWLAVRPIASQHSDDAQMLEGKANFTLRMTHWSEQAEMARGNALDFGWAWVQIGYSTPQGGFPAERKRAQQGVNLLRTVASSQDKAKDQSLGLALRQRLAAGNGRGISPGIEEATPSRPLLWREQFVIPGEVWLAAIMNEDVVMDPKATGTRDAAWISKALWLTRSEAEWLQRVGRLRGPVSEVPAWDTNRQVGKETEELLELRGFDFYQQRAKAQKGEPLLKFWERWDRQTGRYYIISETYEEQTFDDREFPSPTDNFPFYMLSFMPLRQGRAYPQSILANSEPTQALANDLTSLGLEMAKKNKTITAVDETGTFNADTVTAFQKARPGDIVPVPGKPREIMERIEFGHDPAPYFEIRELLKLQDRAQLGIPAEEQALPPSKSTKPTQSALMSRGHQNKMSFRVDVKLYRWYTDIYTDYLSWLKLSAYSSPDVASAEAALLLEPNVFFKNQLGLAKETQSVFKILGLSFSGLETEYQVVAEPIVRTKFDKQQKAQAVLTALNFGVPGGYVNGHKTFRNFARLMDVEDEVVMNEEPDIMDPTMEHLLMAQGIPVAVQPGEDFQKHMQEHQKIAQGIQMAMSGQQVQDPRVAIVVRQFLQNPQTAGLLFEHLNEYAKVFGGGTGSSMEETALAPNQARAGQQQLATEGQRMSGAPIGQGNLGQGIGDILSGGGNF